MGRPGFEPGTNRLKAEYSTVELATQELFFDAFSIVAQVFKRWRRYSETCTHSHGSLPTFLKKAGFLQKCG